MDSNIVVEANLFIIRFLKHHTNKSVQQIIDQLQEENSRLFSQQEEPVMQAGEPLQISRVPEDSQPYIPEAPTVPPPIEITDNGAGEIGDMSERMRR